MIKITVCSQYYRIVSETRYRMPCLVIAAVVVAWSLAMVLLTIFSCIPVESSWDFTIKDKDCSILAKNWIVSLGNIITDFILLIMPLPVILRLEMKPSQKFLTMSTSVATMSFPPLSALGG